MFWKKRSLLIFTKLLIRNNLDSAWKSSACCIAGGFCFIWVNNEPRSRPAATIWCNNFLKQTTQISNSLKTKDKNKQCIKTIDNNNEPRSGQRLPFNAITCWNEYTNKQQAYICSKAYMHMHIYSYMSKTDKLINKQTTIPINKPRIQHFKQKQKQINYDPYTY